MKKWLVYILGILTGFVLTVGIAFCKNKSNNDQFLDGLELFDKPGECMDFSQLEIQQVINPQYSLASVGSDLIDRVLIVSDSNAHYYDNQIITINDGDCVQRIGTFKYVNRMNATMTIPAVRIIKGESSDEDGLSLSGTNGITLFKQPGDCVSKKNFEVQEVLPSGDAIAKEISQQMSGCVFTSDLEVLFKAKDGINYYDNQILKTPKGKCARQIGTYRYDHYGQMKVIPVVDFE